MSSDCKLPVEGGYNTQGISNILAHLIHHQMCYCCQKLEIWEILGADPHVKCLTNQRLRIERGSGVDPLPKSCDLSELIRGLESQNGSALDPLPIPFLGDPLPKVT